MSNLEQAARMALEALQLCANGTDNTMLTRDALASLRQALEQPTVKDCLKVEPNQEQEPYCWKVLGVVSEFTGYYAEEEAKATAKRIGSTCEAFPLYTEPPKSNWQEIECPCCGDLARAFPPPPVSEWVGLTEDEMTEVANTAETYTESVKLTEAALKEKNT